MASYFTVNIALHFLFNWRIEKSVFINIRFSSHGDGAGVSGKINSIMTRAPFLNPFSRPSITQDRIAPGGDAKSDLVKCRSEEKSMRTARKLHLIAPLPIPENSVAPYSNNILNEAEAHDAKVRSGSIVPIKV